VRPPLARAVAVLALASALLSCGGGGTPTTSSPAATLPPEPIDAVEDDFPADPTAQHYHPMHRAAFGPIWGSGCPEWGACGCGGARTLAEEFDCQLDRLAAHDIPVTAYLFDGHAWSQAGSSPANTCSGPDCCSWKLGDGVVRRLARDGVRGLVHFWGGCHAPEQYERVFSRLGRNLLGFYLDDGSSDADLQEVSEFMQSSNPGDWECVAKAFQNREPSTSNTGLGKWSNAAYVGDLPPDHGGLAVAVDRVLDRAAFLPAPFAELTGYGYLDSDVPTEEVYHRRLHFGALQPVMAHTPYANSDPWRPGYSAALVRAYRYWAWLHKELVPYFYSYAYRMFEVPSRTVLRRGPMERSLRVGNEIYAPIVTEPGDTMDVTLPSGPWIDWWDDTRVVSGTLFDYPVPPGREPVFLRLGAIVPMDVENDATGHGTAQSKGSLTVLVYPSGRSWFRYRHDARTPWTVFTSVLSEDQLTLEASPAPPATPLLYRVGRWAEEPRAVAVDGHRVLVNQGGDLPRLAGESAVGASRESAWSYDATSRRLVVKVAASSD
jgi:hypothetical protein